MTVDLTIECPDIVTAQTFPFDLQETAETVLNAFLDAEACPYEASCAVTIVTDEEIRKINSEMRGIDRATDVLSFPMVQYPSPSDFSILEDETAEADAFDPDSGELMLGDIVLSAEHITAQAEAYGHSVRREYAFLITHSLLHLAGYDHMEEKEAAAMEERQRVILSSCGIGRDA